jgi:hypothetical protein
MALSPSNLQKAQAIFPHQSLDDQEIWDSLKCAIASSSGFQGWQREHQTQLQVSDVPLDHQVRRYLRETLETLAY